MGNEQGNALGWLPFIVKALKGRPNRPWLGRRFRAPSSIGPRFPGRCPGLLFGRPVGARDRPTQKRIQVSEDKRNGAAPALILIEGG